LLRSKESARSINDAIVSLGPCLFHTVVLLCAVTEFGAPEYRDQNAEALWSHSVQMAILAEKIAEQSEYPVRGAAFVAGLLHDIGYLPLLEVAREQEKTFDEIAAIPWRDRIDLEQDIFGIDHCQVGQWMAKSWKFSPSLIDAVWHHHDPRKAEKDSHLAEIICAAEYHCSISLPQQVAQLPV
jgi:putative nucleotidyltransferase with HDIG domain